MDDKQASLAQMAQCVATLLPSPVQSLLAQIREDQFRSSVAVDLAARFFDASNTVEITASAGEMLAFVRDRMRRARLTKFKTARRRHFDLFSFEEALNYYVAGIGIADRQKARDWFLEKLETSVLLGEFRENGDRIGILTDDVAFVLSAERLQSIKCTHDAETVKNWYLLPCWTMAALGIDWCERHQIELPPRWKRHVGNAPKEASSCVSQPLLPEIAAAISAPPKLGRPSRKERYLAILEEHAMKAIVAPKISQEARNIAAKAGADADSPKSIENIIRARYNGIPRHKTKQH